jgi:acyl transferase domain-containing protein
VFSLQVILGALEAAEVAAADVATLEMHGTGTPLGAWPAGAAAVSSAIIRHTLTANTDATGQSASRYIQYNIQCAGDPIEVGAATAVLAGGRAPVRFTAAKARIGHTEPAAGAVGIVHVSSRPELMPCLVMMMVVPRM